MATGACTQRVGFVPRGRASAAVRRCRCASADCELEEGGWCPSLRLRCQAAGGEAEVHTPRRVMTRDSSGSRDGSSLSLQCG